MTASKRKLMLAVALVCASWQASAGMLNKSGRDLTLTMPMMAEGRKLGELLMQLDTKDNILLDSQGFLQLMRPHVSDEHFERMTKLVGTKQFFSWYVLGVLGYNLEYDQSKLLLRLILPPDLKATTRIGGPRSKPFGSPAELPSQTSAYTNVYAGVTRSDNGLDSRERTTLVLDSAVSVPALNHATIENESRFNDNEDLVRQGTRVVMDQRDKNRRWQGGDVATNNFSYMGSENIAGVQVTSNRSTFRPTLNQITGRTSFLLQQESTVRVYINNILETTLRLAAGPYELNDLPIDYGSNRVVVEIEDDAGKVQVLSFDLFSDSTFLNKGVTELSAAAGTERDFKNGKIDYTDRKVASGYFRKGISDRVTAGVYGKVKEDIRMAGVEALAAVPGGRLSAETAATRDDQGGETEYAVNAGVTHEFPYIQDGRSRQLFVGAESTSNRFNTTVSDSPREEKVTARVNYDQTLDDNWRMGVDAEHATNRTLSDEERYRARLGYVNRNLSVSLEVQHEKGTTEDTSATVRLTNRFDANTAMYASTDTDQNTDLSLRKNSKRRGVGAWGANLDIENDGKTDTTALVAGGLLTTNRADLSFSHGTDLATGSGGEQSYTNASVATAVAYAGGKVAVGRPVGDSFMIVSGHKNLDGRRVEVQPSNAGEYEAASGALGPALANSVSSYVENTVRYDVQDLPLGYNLGDGNRQVFPTYRSGYTTTVGTAATVTAIGRLVDKDGKPVKLLAGIATPIQAETTTPVQLFTNSAGRFSAQGLSPGTWQLAIKGKRSTLKYTLSIPENTVGLLNTGQLSPQ